MRLNSNLIRYFVLMIPFIACPLNAEVKNVECALDVSKGVCTLKEGLKVCDSYREYVTAYNYLQDKKKTEFTKDQASQTAFKIAQGCDGAAGRFIRVFDLLVNAKFALNEASEVAIAFAESDPDSADAFADIFKAAYLEKNLDLSLQIAVNIARELTLNEAGGSAKARKDYIALVDYCLSKGGLSLPKPDCAKLALQVAKLGANGKTKDKLVSKPFIELVEFLRMNEKGPRIATYEAIEVARQVVEVDVEAAKNFIQGYKFAREQNRLNLDRNKAIDFAKKLAKLTVQQSALTKSQKQI